MKTLEILGKKVTIDTEKLSEGLCDLHNQDEGKRTMLAFGMLDHGLCEMFDKILMEKVRSQYSSDAVELFGGRIDKFVTECSNEIQKGVYQYAKMVV